MNLRLIPFQAVGLASVSLVEPGGSRPSHVRVVDLAVGLTVRRMAIGPTEDMSSRLAALASGTTPGTGPLSAARLDALIDLVERDGGAGSHECGGA